MLESVPKELEQPDWGLLKNLWPLSSYSREELEKINATLSEGLRWAEKIMACQDLINKGQNPQLIVQSMGMEAMVRTLWEKEKGKQKEQAVLFPDGLGRHLTAPDFVNERRALEVEKARKETEKKRKREAKENKRAAKAQFDEQWKAVRKAHDLAVEEWKGRCTQLRDRGTKLKDLPKRTRMQKKADLEKEMGLVDKSDDENGDEDA